MNEEEQEDMPQALNAAEEAGIHGAVEEFLDDVRLDEQGRGFEILSSHRCGCNR